MKKIISFLLAALLLVSAVPMVHATNDYSQGTQVVYEATGSESYTITVPAQLAPGGNGTVTLSGTWADNRVVTVTADPTVTLTNSIKAEDQKVLNVNFDGISEVGSNTTSQTFTQGIFVDGITDALFGTWSGKFNYNVGIGYTPNARLEGDGQTFHTLAPSTLSFRSTAPLSEFKEVKVNGKTIDPSNYTLTEGSTIVTLSIDYLKTLDVADHEITVVSESGSPSAGFSVIEPEQSEQGFYYNQPYNAYVDYFGDTLVFFFREGGTMDVIFVDGNYVAQCTYTGTPGSFIVTGEEGETYTGTVAGDSMSVYCNELATTFELGNDVVVADEEYVYFYWGGDENNEARYTPRVIDKTKTSYKPVKSNINGIPITMLDMTYVDCVNMTSTPQFPSSVTELHETFANCTALEVAIIPDTIQLIAFNVFLDCTNLKTITLSKNTQLGGQYMFYGCSNLEKIIVEDGHEKLFTDEYGALYSRYNDIALEWFPATSNITSYTILEGTISVGGRNNPFESARNLKHITLPESIESFIIYHNSSLETITVESATPFILGHMSHDAKYPFNAIYVPAESVEIYKAADDWSRYADIIQAIPN